MMARILSKILLALAMVTVASTGVRGNPRNSLFNPADYPPLATNLVFPCTLR